MKSVIALISLFVICSCGGTSKKQDSVFIDSLSMKEDSIYYTCTMHPQIISKASGVCPKCGMDLSDFVYHSK